MYRWAESIRKLDDQGHMLTQIHNHNDADEQLDILVYDILYLYILVHFSHHFHHLDLCILEKNVMTSGHEAQLFYFKLYS